MTHASLSRFLLAFAWLFQGAFRLHDKEMRSDNYNQRKSDQSPTVLVWFIWVGSWNKKIIFLATRIKQGVSWIVKTQYEDR